MVLETLPPSTARILPILALLLIGIFVEKHYVSRISTFANAMALVVYLTTIEASGTLFTLYVEFGVLLGMYGFIKYVLEESITSLYYSVSFYLYGSVTVALLMLLDPIPAILLASAIHVGMVLWKDGYEAWVHTGPRPFDVKWFIQENGIEYPDYQAGVWRSAPLTDAFDPDRK